MNEKEIFKSNTFFAWAKFLEIFIKAKPAYATILKILRKHYKSEGLLAVCIRDGIQKLEQVHATQVHAGGIIDPSLLYDNSMDKVTFLRNLEKKQFESWKDVDININALMDDPKLVGENDKETLAKILKDYVDYKTDLHLPKSTPLAT
ncbi:unnamed protein product [Peronospora belbahrii]|uniref:Uncharacterized protein n=1 Tax=Peronospora belbahrii TaxID=622444 RepID=A0ABN8DAP3_9STRA|nr:unnamed protein product [Peronospora belbahrii]